MAVSTSIKLLSMNVLKNSQSYTHIPLEDLFVSLPVLTSGGIKSILNMKAVVESWGAWQANPDTHEFEVTVLFLNTDYVQEIKTFLQVSLSGVDSILALKNSVQSALLNYANNTQSYGMSASDIIWAFPSLAPAGMVNAPQAAISNAPTDAPTNLNVITTLLGTLVGEVNATNAKQNEIATKLNSLLASQRTMGLIAS